MTANIETVLTQTIPLFEHVLTDLHRNNPLRHRIPGTCHYQEKCKPPEEPEVTNDEQAWMKYDNEMREWSSSRLLVQPDVENGGYPGGFEYRKNRVSLRGRTVNVVVRLTEIRLVSGLGI
jgi:hypothetical protein